LPAAGGAFLFFPENRSWAWMKSAEILHKKGLKNAQGVPAAVRRAFLKPCRQEFGAIGHGQ